MQSGQEIINERKNNSESSTDQPPRSVTWESDVYSQVFGNDKSEYVRGLGLGPTPSVLWGSRSSLGNIVAEGSSNEAVQRLTQEITELKDKHNEEMNLMKQNQEKMQSELLQMKQLVRKYVSNETTPQNINGTSSDQVLNANSGHERVPQHQGYLVLLKILYYLKELLIFILRCYYLSFYCLNFPQFFFIIRILISCELARNGNKI